MSEHTGSTHPAPGTAPGTAPAASITAPASAVGDSLLERHYFLFRRLHSLSGILPVGVFVFEHLFTNSAILLGEQEFQRDINFIYLLPGLLMMEIFGIWLPIAFHAGLGLVYAFSGRPNSAAYRYGDNHRYTLMRVSGYIALIYIFFHLSSTRWGWSWGGLGVPFEHEHATLTTAQALQATWWMPYFYLVGVLAVVFHFANGLWTAAITWGLTVTPAAMRRWGHVCLTVGIVLAAMGVGSVWKFSTYPLNESPPAKAAQVQPPAPANGGATADANPGGLKLNVRKVPLH